MIARATSAVSYPARFTLVAAMNPCPCGYWGDKTRVCVCGEDEAMRYRSRLSGPLLDRIDLHQTLCPVPLRQLGATEHAESSEVVRKRVEAARTIQRERWKTGAASTNARASGRLLLKHLTADARELLHGAAESLSLSARAYHRVVKVARTIADLAGRDAIATHHVAESLQFRPR